MEKVLVTGGTGNLGKWIIEYLLQHNFNVAILSSQTNISLKNDIEILKGDLANNTGLTQSTADADIIIHCASNPRNFEKTDIEGTRNLLSSINRKRIQHFIYISIVGVDKSDYTYYQAKYAAEQMIAGSGIPFTILRTTQFHSFILSMVQSFVNDQSSGIVKIPMRMKFQSVDIREVAKQLVDCLGQAAGLLPDFGGPEILSFEEMVRVYLSLSKTNLILQPENLEGKRYDLFRSGVNLCPDRAYGKITWKSFLAENLQI
jgi:uncharacterized protein YbjT (DUF2867 family)